MFFKKWLIFFFGFFEILFFRNGKFASESLRKIFELFISTLQYYLLSKLSLKWISLLTVPTFPNQWQFYHQFMKLRYFLKTKLFLVSDFRFTKIKFNAKSSIYAKKMSVVQNKSLLSIQYLLFYFFIVLTMIVLTKFSIIISI